MIRWLERAGALEGDVATLDRRELDDVAYRGHEYREARHRLADARVVEGHQPAAAGRVIGVLLPVSAAVPAVMAPLTFPFIVFVVVPGLELMAAAACHRCRRRGLVELPRHGGPHPREGPQAARLVGEVDLRPAEDLSIHRLMLCEEGEE